MGTIMLLSQFKKDIDLPLIKESFNNCSKLVLEYMETYQKDILERFHESLENIFSPVYDTYLSSSIPDTNNVILKPCDLESDIWNNIESYAQQADELSFQQLQVHLEKLIRIINAATLINPKNQKGQEIISSVNSTINQKFDKLLLTIKPMLNKWDFIFEKPEEITKTLNELVNTFYDLKEAKTFVGDNIEECDEKIEEKINLVKSKIMEIISIFDNRPNFGNIGEFKSKFYLLKEMKSCSGLQSLLNFDEFPHSIAQEKQVQKGKELLESLKDGNANATSLQPVKLICEIDLSIKYELNSNLTDVLNSVFRTLEKNVGKLEEELEKPKLDITNIAKSLRYIKKYS